MANLVLVGASWSLSLTKSHVSQVFSEDLCFSVSWCSPLSGALLFECSVGRSA